ncbi:hypothetical protein ACFFQW_06280 [Umezawaea endophytica]|uniref:Fibronectin type-III domain-containing protein n=1 Tax=Umezawaea endophytica TaxID=1654476 RepID=A0A9X3A2W2_9PSEU|nr:hypothetical protein [Umezawaea endophytica]MCS7481064.1 hypothetical protein [Umezawaea endophytica]
MGLGQRLARVGRRVVGSGGRESASFGAALVGVMLLAGAAFGNGISRTAVSVSDGLTWLGDDERGEVVQVNPSSGKPQTRLQISGGDAQLEIAQDDGTLIVLDRRTGQITVIDLSTLLSSGRRQAPAGASAKVLIAQGRVFVVDRTAGTIHNADPVTLADIGAAWSAGQPLADVVVDDSGLVWAVDHGGNLHALEWSDDQERFVEKSNRPVPGAGPRTALVPHDMGVTLLGLEGGVVLQDGTGQPLSVMTVQLTGDVLAAAGSPSDLVPAAVPDSGVVVLVSGDKVLRVDVAGFGCSKPGRPAVFRGKVYVPCHGAGKVVVLDGGGKKSGDDVLTQGSGDPELVFDDGKLFINTPGASQGVIVDSDGTTRSVTVRSPDLAVTDPDREPLPTVPPPPPPRPEELPTGTRVNSNGNQPPAVTTTVVAPPTTTGSVSVDGVPGKPPGVSVSLKSRDASTVVVTVSWGAVTPATGYTVTASGSFSGGSRTAQVAGTSTDLSIPCGGSTFCASGSLDVSVTAYSGAGTSAASTAAWSVPPAGTTPPPVVTTTTQPPPPPPVVTTTTEPPPPPVVTTTTTEPPPPPSLPQAGATLITSITGGVASYIKTVNMAWPADWASHNGTCEVVNTTFGYSTPIACGTTQTTIDADIGPNRIVVRAYAATGGGSVDSLSKSTTVRDLEQCGNKPCQVPRSAPEAPESAPMGAGGLGLIAVAALLRVGRRRDDEEGEVR